MILMQSVGDLFGRPLLGAQEFLDLVPQPRPFGGPALLRAERLVVGPFLSLIGPIRRPAPVHGDLRDRWCPDVGLRRSMRGVGLISFDAHPDLFTILEGQGLVSLSVRSRNMTTPCSATRAATVFFDTPRQRRRLRVGRPPSNRLQRHPHHPKGHPRMSHTDTSRWELSRAHPLRPPVPGHRNLYQVQVVGSSGRRTRPSTAT